MNTKRDNSFGWRKGAKEIDGNDGWDFTKDDVADRKHQFDRSWNLGNLKKSDFQAMDCSYESEADAIRRAEGMSRDPANAGAVAFKRAGDPNVGEFSDGVVLKKFGDVPEDLSALSPWSYCCVMTGSRGWICPVVARPCSAHQLPLLRRSRAPPQCSDW